VSTTCTNIQTLANCSHSSADRRRLQRVLA
jgi:hypothetical protein